jgi:nitrate/nitrite transport system permease protein
MDRLALIFGRLGLTWFVPVVHVIAGRERAYQMRLLLRLVGLPLIAIILVLFAWQVIALQVQVGTMHLPTPGQVWARGIEQVVEMRAEGVRHAQYEKDLVGTAAELKMSVDEVRQQMPFASKKLFIDQVLLSLKTAFVGVGLAMVVAIPLGIICGLSNTIFSMVNPMIQVLKPVSPLAWFPVVYLLCNSAVSNHGPVSKSFLVAALVVALCSLWPALINTANGVANVERDHLNVAKVLNLNFFEKVWRIILPAALPSIFTGIRLSLGIGWMVLIAAEMMAVSPGLGSFIWDWYQSSNETSLSYLMLAVVVIGVIGFLLDRIMIAIQRVLSHGNTAAIR